MVEDLHALGLQAPERAPDIHEVREGFLPDIGKPVAFHLRGKAITWGRRNGKAAPLRLFIDVTTYVYNSIGNLQDL